MRRMMRLRALPALTDRDQFVFRHADAACGFLLKHVQHVDDARQLHGVHRAIDIAIEVIDDLDEAGEFTLEAFRRAVMPTELRLVQAKPKTRRGSPGSARKSSRLEPIHCIGFSASASGSDITEYA